MSNWIEYQRQGDSSKYRCHRIWVFAAVSLINRPSALLCVLIQVYHFIHHNTRSGKTLHCDLIFNSYQIQGYSCMIWSKSWGWITSCIWTVHTLVTVGGWRVSGSGTLIEKVSLHIMYIIKLSGEGGILSYYDRVPLYLGWGWVLKVKESLCQNQIPKFKLYTSKIILKVHLIIKIFFDYYMSYDEKGWLLSPDQIIKHETIQIRI